MQSSQYWVQTAFIQIRGYLEARNRLGGIPELSLEKYSAERFLSDDVTDEQKSEALSSLASEVSTAILRKVVGQELPVPEPVDALSVALDVFGYRPYIEAMLT